MGIGSNYYVEVAEEEYRDALRKEMARDAAIDVVNGNERTSSINAARNRIEAQQAALSANEYEEYDGVIHFHDSSIESPAMPKGKEAQVNAIANELIEHFD